MTEKEKPSGKLAAQMTLGRRVLFVDENSVPPPKIPRPPLPPHIIDTGLVICPDGSVATVAIEPKRGPGRPTIGKPWNDEGISRSAWFANRKKETK